MLYQITAMLLALLVAGPALAIKGSFNSSGPMDGRPGSPERSYSPDDMWLLAESLFNPVVFAAGVTVSAIPRNNMTVRLRYGTSPANYTSTITRCYKDRITTSVSVDADGTCNVTKGTRVDFVFCDGGSTDCLNEDTRYHYIIEELVGSTWAQRPAASFLTLDTDVTAVQNGLVTNDEHFWKLHTTGCGLDTSDDYAYQSYSNGIHTLQNIRSRNSTKNYRWYGSTGDWVQFHHNTMLDAPCLIIDDGKGPGGCGIVESCSDAKVSSIKSQSEAEVKLILTLRQIQSVTRSIPFFWTRGNHDPSFSYAEYHGTELNTSDNGHWYIDSTNNINTHGIKATNKIMPNPDFTYGSTDGNCGVRRMRPRS